MMKKECPKCGQSVKGNNPKELERKFDKHLMTVHLLHNHKCTRLNLENLIEVMELMK